MQIDTNTLLYVVLGLLGAGYKLLSKWMSEVDKKLDGVSDIKLECTKKFMTRTDYEQSKQHVWDKLDDHEDRLRELELKR